MRARLVRVRVARLPALVPAVLPLRDVDRARAVGDDWVEDDEAIGVGDAVEGEAAREGEGFHPPRLVRAVLAAAAVQPNVHRAAALVLARRRHVHEARRREARAGDVKLGLPKGEEAALVVAQRLWRPQRRAVEVAQRLARAVDATVQHRRQPVAGVDHRIRGERVGAEGVEELCRVSDGLLEVARVGRAAKDVDALAGEVCVRVVDEAKPRARTCHGDNLAHVLQADKLIGVRLRALARALALHDVQPLPWRACAHGRVARHLGGVDVCAADERVAHFRFPAPLAWRELVALEA